MPNDHAQDRPLWGSRVQAPLTPVAQELSSSTDVDRPLAVHDIAATRAHLHELERLELLDAAGRAKLDEALAAVATAIADGSFAWSEEHEDVHMNVEAAVRAAVGPELAGQLQAGRSRNEEVVTDERLWLLAAAQRLDAAIEQLQRTLVTRAEEHLDTVLPAHTHTQPAQPMLLAHHLLAYVEMLDRDRGRLTDAARRADASPAGSGAAVGSGLPLDRDAVARRIGFSAITANSLDAVADRDYAVELTAAAATALMHLSRMAADLVSWSTPYYRFARIGDGHATGSSMLPNKRNPDIAELVRARAARAQGELATVVSVQAGLPLGYHRDLQETRGPMQRTVASLELCLAAMDEMMAGATFDPETMAAAAGSGHALATALAERLLRAGVPFRDAHWRVGELVARAEAAGCDLADLPVAELRDALPELGELDPIVPSLAEAIAAADLPGGTAPNRVRTALDAARERITAS
ncbi:MAG TPA: argininosuccinate lyase [Patescibacteria group bacterium]|nr:argininosuccinate lyase [Patescibacteria group bacterium]